MTGRIHHENDTANLPAPPPASGDGPGERSAALHEAWVRNGGDQYFGPLFWDEVVARFSEVAAVIESSPPASGDAALRHAISVLENYGDHHEWCARAGGSGEPCNCGLWDELERLRFALTEGATE